MGSDRRRDLAVGADAGDHARRASCGAFASGVRTLPAARAGGGWTLIEVLVVITVIAVLAGLSIPVAGSMVSSARAARCAAGLRGFGQAFQAYRQANHDLYPFANGWVDVRVGRIAPLDALAPHLDVPLPTWDGQAIMVNEPYRCPADRLRAADTGFSYFYLPQQAMSTWAAASDRNVAIVEYSRKLGEKPKEILLLDFDGVHAGRFNNLRVDGSVTR